MSAILTGQVLSNKAIQTLAAVIFAASLSLLASTVHAQGEHARRVASELTVIAADLQKLGNTSTSKLHAKGLKKRIEGSIVTLDILTRLADQELNKPIHTRYDEFSLLQQDLEQDRLETLLNAITMFREEYPLFLPDILIEDTKEFEELHKSLCSACHDTPNLEVERPAYNLSKQILDGSELDMYARLLVGVRGDHMTGIDNPLSDVQIIGLMRFYQRR